MSEIKALLTNDMKAAMKAKEKENLMVIRSIIAAFKQYEIDSRADIDDTQALAIIDKLAKQRRESIKQFSDAGRDDLVQQEAFELSLIESYLPEALSAEEVQRLIQEAIADVSPAGMQDMGKVMAWLKPKLQGRADMGHVSQQIKQALAG